MAKKKKKKKKKHTRPPADRHRAPASRRLCVRAGLGRRGRREGGPGRRRGPRPGWPATGSARAPGGRPQPPPLRAAQLLHQHQGVHHPAALSAREAPPARPPRHRRRDEAGAPAGQQRQQRAPPTVGPPGSAACDLSIDMLQQRKEVIARRRRRRKREQLPCSATVPSTDTYSTADVIEHVADVEAVFAEGARVLRPGGSDSAAVTPNGKPGTTGPPGGRTGGRDSGKALHTSSPPKPSPRRLAPFEIVEHRTSPVPVVHRP